MWSFRPRSSLQVWCFFSLGLWPALIFGVLIAATDPIAVIALFKDIGVTGRLRLLVESESLFNDGVAAVLFGLALTWTQAPAGASLSGSDARAALAKVAGGGVLVGIACGVVAMAIAWRTSDHLVETALTAVAAYGSFLLAESFHLSGVLATVAAGLLMGNLGVPVDDEKRGALSSRGVNSSSPSGISRRSSRIRSCFC